MFARRSISARRLNIRPPDYREQRDDRSLLIWSSVPHWMVVDGEFAALLAELDGSTLKTLLACHPDWQRRRRLIVRQLRSLIALGIARFDTQVSPTDNPDDALAPIENVAVNLTRRCNLRCRFCYNLDALDTNPASELAADEIIPVLEQARPLLAKHPSLTVLGGEPLLFPEKLLQLAQYGARRGYANIVSTNGTLISEDFARRARQLRLQVQVSVDGPDAAVHDAVRGAGTFAKAREGIRILVKNRVYTILSLVCHKQNFPRLEDFYRFALSEHANEARFIPLKRMGGALHCELEPVPLTQMFRQAAGMFASHPEFLRLAGRDALSIQATSCSHAVRRRSCGTGLQTFLIDSDGTLYPCLNTNSAAFAFANVRDNGFQFAHVWTHSPILRSFRKSTRVDSGPTCSRCHVRYWCLGGCKGETYANTGAFTGPAWNCPDLRSSISELLWLIAEHPDLIKPSKQTC